METAAKKVHLVSVSSGVMLAQFIRGALKALSPLTWFMCLACVPAPREVPRTPAGVPEPTEPRLERVEPNPLCDARTLNEVQAGVGAILERHPSTRTVRGMPIAYSERVVCGAFGPAECREWAEKQVRLLRKAEDDLHPALRVVPEELREAQFKTKVRAHRLVYSNLNDLLLELRRIRAAEGPIGLPEARRNAGAPESSRPTATAEHTLFIDHHRAARELKVPASTWVYEVTAHSAAIFMAFVTTWGQPFVVSRESRDRAQAELTLALPRDEKVIGDRELIEMLLSDDPERDTVRLELQVYCRPSLSYQPAAPGKHSGAQRLSMRSTRTVCASGYNGGPN